MRPEDIIADAIRRLDPKTLPDDAARKIMEALEREGLHLKQPSQRSPWLACPMCGDD